MLSLIERLILMMQWRDCFYETGIRNTGVGILVEKWDRVVIVRIGVILRVIYLILNFK